MSEDSPETQSELPPGARQFTLLDEPKIHLPTGMTMADWTLEKIRWQNPRIRALLGCIRLLGGVLESNYAILHCSPERLLEIWRKVRQVADLVRTEIDPLLSNPSRFPDLEEARHRVGLSLKMLTNTVLRDLEQFETPPPRSDLLELRKMLCVSIGKMHAFLQDSFGELLANDPRSSHNYDYFLSRRFPQDLEEAEWLHSTVNRLKDYMDQLDSQRIQGLTHLAHEISREQALPTVSRWQETETLLDTLLDVLTPKLREVLALRGIRFYEMEILDRYAVEIPFYCRHLRELFTLGRQLDQDLKKVSGSSRPEKEQNVQDLLVGHQVFSRKLVQMMVQMDKELQDLVAFVPLWLDSIEKRRALLLKRGSDGQLEPLQTEPTPDP